jgi:hypothetical protein
MLCHKKKLAFPLFSGEKVSMKFHWKIFCFCATALLPSFPLPASPAEESSKPVLLYSRYFNAPGESRYLPDRDYKGVLERLSADFTVRVHSEPLTTQTLAGVAVVLIANPSDKAVGTNPPPNHVSAADVETLDEFVRKGGGLIVMENQENHNLEVGDSNRLLARFGILATNLYTDAKQIVLPDTVPMIGGLRWAYYTGNLLLLDYSHSARPRALVLNDLKQKPLKGARDQAGVLLAAAEPGKGRVLAVTDSGWIADWAFSGEGVGGVSIKEQDNWEIFHRLARWAAHK